LEATGYLAETTGYLAIDQELSDAALSQVGPRAESFQGARLPVKRAGAVQELLGRIARS
jgi:hypothetical protein